MKVDLYKRPDTDGDFSYLAVPSGRVIPDEATSLDWETVRQDEELRPDELALLDVSADELQQQIDRKGYAISSVVKQSGDAER